MNIDDATHKLYEAAAKAKKDCLERGVPVPHFILTISKREQGQVPAEYLLEHIINIIDGARDQEERIEKLQKEVQFMSGLSEKHEARTVILFEKLIEMLEKKG